MQCPFQTHPEIRSQIAGNREGLGGVKENIGVAEKEDLKFQWIIRCNGTEWNAQGCLSKIGLGLDSSLPLLQVILAHPLTSVNVGFLIGKNGGDYVSIES